MFADKKPSWLLRAHTLGVTIAVLVFVAAALSGAGYANEWWDDRTAFTILRYAVYGALGLVAIALITLWAIAIRTALTRGYAVRSIVSLVLFVACLGFSWNVYSQLQTARQVPPIHDVTTDLDDIPQYVALNPQNPNRDDWELLHRAGYRDLRPITLEMSVAEVIEKAEALSIGFGWDVAAALPEEGRLEVTETTRWFRFKDDLILRVRPGENGKSVVDARSVSRFAGSDIGVNAARIRKLFAALQK